MHNIYHHYFISPFHILYFSLTAKMVDFALIFRNPRNRTYFCTLTVPCRCWKSYLPYSKRSENIINRKNIKFYIEAIPPKFSQLRKNIFVSSSKKFEFFFDQKKFENCRQKSGKKSQIANLNIPWDLRFEIHMSICLPTIFRKFFGRKNSEFFFWTRKKIRSWEKFWGIASM